ncbi:MULTISPECIES: DegV family protein [Bacillaceae]|uniref:DegV family protein n=1 Tax=Bacillaceae TaxID=186817 RepID=UPI001E5989CB|nr:MULTISPECIES: DegV family protein [Bacillaceae]MCE4047316.1 DegV family protein [Bacillus sp. Au-Bac7]MDL0437115.1 DegV family protein [Niallia sp. SS-2023]UPO86324.1 DegV family protein [Niallia sp. Man26]
MKKIKIVTDSTADLASELIEKYDIEVIPLSISINGETFLDRVDINPAEFIQKMKEAENLPKTSQPPVGVFLETYNKLADEGYTVISIHMTGGMSGTVDSARSAAALTEADVTVIDSEYISKALSFQVIEAAMMAQNGVDKEDILAKIQHVKKHTKLFVVVDTLENLIKGGRIGKGKAFIGSLLNIKPIASLEDGVYTPVTKVRSRAQAVKFLANAFAEECFGKTIKRVGITHADSLDYAKMLSDAIEKVSGFNKIEIDFTTPVISTHTGQGALGFSYYAE